MSVVNAPHQNFKEVCFEPGKALHHVHESFLTPGWYLFGNKLFKVAIVFIGIILVLN